MLGSYTLGLYINAILRVRVESIERMFVLEKTAIICVTQARVFLKKRESKCIERKSVKKRRVVRVGHGWIVYTLPSLRPISFYSIKVMFGG